jgi:hypothetical protein
MVKFWRGGCSWRREMEGLGGKLAFVDVWGLMKS